MANAVCQMSLPRIWTSWRLFCWRRNQQFWFLLSKTSCIYYQSYNGRQRCSMVRYRKATLWLCGHQWQDIRTTSLVVLSNLCCHCSVCLQPAFQGLQLYEMEWHTLGIRHWEILDLKKCSVLPTYSTRTERMAITPCVLPHDEEKSIYYYCILLNNFQFIILFYPSTHYASKTKLEDEECGFCLLISNFARYFQQFPLPQPPRTLLTPPCATPLTSYFLKIIRGQFVCQA